MSSLSPLIDLLKHNPAGARAREAVEGTLRGVLDELLTERGTPGRAELEEAHAALAAAHAAIGAQEERLAALRAEVDRLGAAFTELRRGQDDLQLDLAESREAAVQAEARADAAERTLAAAQARIAALEGASPASPQGVVSGGPARSGRAPRARKA